MGSQSLCPLIYMAEQSTLSSLQVGVGFRRGLAELLLDAPVECFDFVELAPENYLGFGGQKHRLLERVADRWPVLTHGLALSLGGNDPFPHDYLEELGQFLHDLETPHHSDHLCISSANGSHSHELLPLPLTRDTAHHTARRIREVSSAIQKPFAVEHISAYARWPEDELSEPEFIRQVVEESDCGLLLDLNNLYVNACNFGLDASEMLEQMPLEATVQIHMAGHTVRHDGLRIDTHSEDITDEVYSLLKQALPRTGPVPVLLERDDNFPALKELLRETHEIRQIGNEVFHAR